MVKAKMIIDLKLKIEISGQATFDDIVDYISLLGGVGSCHIYNPLMGSPYIEAKEKRAKPYADKENAIMLNLNQFTDDRF